MLPSLGSEKFRYRCVLCDLLSKDGYLVDVSGVGVKSRAMRVRHSGMCVDKRACGKHTAHRSTFSRNCSTLLLVAFTRPFTHRFPSSPSLIAFPHRFVNAHRFYVWRELVNVRKRAFEHIHSERSSLTSPKSFITLLYMCLRSFASLRL